MRYLPHTRRLLRMLAIAQLLCVAHLALARDRVLEIYVENAADPFSRPDGTGYANDVVRAAFESVGVRIKFNVVPYARCKNEVLIGEGVACVSMSPDPSFEGRIKFADTPLITVTPVYYENPARPLTAGSEAESSKGVIIGTIRGYEYTETAMKAKALGAVFEENVSDQANLKKLALRRLDAVMAMSNPPTGVEHWARDAKVANLVKVAFRNASSELGYFAVSIAHPDGPRTLKQYKAGIKSSPPTAGSIRSEPDGRLTLLM
ncbi:MAG TPA: hypothetical protein VHX14_10925 [Thermoanaerobaculia bacterium]|nr:hypothetical protein [Thermoanaerobaculia bacterium]